MSFLIGVVLHPLDAATGGVSISGCMHCSLSLLTLPCIWRDHCASNQQGNPMKATSVVLFLGVWGMHYAQAQAPSPSSVEVTLTRLDCGTAPQPSDVARFSDTYAYQDFKVQLTYSCYLIKHGN